jgi:hypothetical protein
MAQVAPPPLAWFDGGTGRGFHPDATMAAPHHQNGHQNRNSRHSTIRTASSPPSTSNRGRQTTRSGNQKGHQRFGWPHRQAGVLVASKVKPATTTAAALVHPQHVPARRSPPAQATTEASSGEKWGGRQSTQAVAGQIWALATAPSRFRADPRAGSQSGSCPMPCHGPAQMEQEQAGDVARMAGTPADRQFARAPPASLPTVPPARLAGITPAMR